MGLGLGLWLGLWLWLWLGLWLWYRDLNIERAVSRRFRLISVTLCQPHDRMVHSLTCLVQHNASQVGAPLGRVREFPVARDCMRRDGEGLLRTIFPTIRVRVKGLEG